ncbi:GHKL domain-containing protein, partial [Escherichia coli]|nr:GHKL domain-containing protein [Escherichia coli]
MNSVTKQIKDLALAGFLMGKMSYAREEQVQLSMNVINQIPEPQDSQLTHHLITIIGNLVDNGIDAVKDNKKSKKVSAVLKYENERLLIEISDNGYGMSS